MSIVYSAIPLATIVNYPLSSFLCESGLDEGWPMVFYVPGIAGLVLTFSFPFVVYNKPSEHPRISLEEKKYLNESCKITTSKNNSLNSIPWRQMATSRPMHALWITHVAFLWCFYLTALNIPRLVRHVFEMDIIKGGLVSALPFIGMFIMSLSSGKVFDYLRIRNIMTLTNLRKTFNSIGFFGAALATFSLHFVTDRIGAIALLTTSMTFLQLANTGGFFFSHSDLVGPHSGIAFGFTNTMAQLPGIINPLLVAYMTPDDSREEWFTVYDIGAAICIFGGLVYLFFGSSELQPWVQNQKDQNQNVDIRQAHHGTAEWIVGMTLRI